MLARVHSGLAISVWTAFSPFAMRRSGMGQLLPSARAIGMAAQLSTADVAGAGSEFGLAPRAVIGAHAQGDLLESYRQRGHSGLPLVA